MAEVRIKVEGNLRDIAKKLHETPSTVQRWAALRIFAEIQKGNPVDTGFSRSNWNLSMDQPDYTVRGIRQQGATYAPATPAVPGDNPTLRPIFISNGVNYVKYLEEGSSKQAPNGFIRIAVEKVSHELASKA